MLDEVNEQKEYFSTTGNADLNGAYTANEVSNADYLKPQALAKMYKPKTKLVAIKDIVMDDDFRVRKTENCYYKGHPRHNELINFQKDLQKDIREGRFNPATDKSRERALVTMEQSDGTYLLVEGYQRLQAYRATRQKKCRVTIFTGDKLQAQALSKNLNRDKKAGMSGQERIEASYRFMLKLCELSIENEFSQRTLHKNDDSVSYKSWGNIRRAIRKFIDEFEGEPSDSLEDKRSKALEGLRTTTWKKLRRTDIDLKDAEVTNELKEGHMNALQEFMAYVNTERNSEQRGMLWETLGVLSGKDITDYVDPFVWEEYPETSTVDKYVPNEPEELYFP